MPSHDNRPSHDLCLTVPRLASERTEEFLTPKQAADYLRVSKSYLDKLRVYGGGPRFLRFGRKILYRQSELNFWAEQRSFELDQRIRSWSFPNETTSTCKEVDMTSKPVSRFFTIKQIAEQLSVSTRSVRRWIARGELLAHKFSRQVRVSELDLRTFLEGHHAR